MENTLRLAIIDNETHTLYVEDVYESKIEECGGEEEYINQNYKFNGSYSWDYIIDAQYIPEDPEYGQMEIDFKKLVD